MGWINKILGVSALCISGNVALNELSSHRYLLKKNIKILDDADPLVGLCKDYARKMNVSKWRTQRLKVILYDDSFEYYSLMCSLGSISQPIIGIDSNYYNYVNAFEKSASDNQKKVTITIQKSKIDLMNQDIVIGYLTGYKFGLAHEVAHVHQWWRRFIPYYTNFMQIRMEQNADYKAGNIGLALDGIKYFSARLEIDKQCQNHYDDTTHPSLLERINSLEKLVDH